MTLAAWRDLSIVLLAIQTLLMVAIVGAILYLLNRGMTKLRGAIRRYAPIIQSRLWEISDASKRVSEQLAAPVINAETAGATARRWFVSLRVFIHR